MKVYWIRHGKTKFNLERKLQGWLDSPLLKEDDSHIKAYEKIKNIKFDAYCSSDLKRAIDTRNLILEQLELKLKDDIYEEFREISFGDLEGENIEYVKGKYSEMWKKLKARSDEYDLKYLNAETINDVYNRCMLGIKKLKEKYGENSTILLVSHGTTIAIMNELDKVPENGEVFIKEY